MSNSMTIIGKFLLELSDDPNMENWLEVSDKVAATTVTSDNSLRQVGVRLALAHPFMQRFGGTNSSDIEPLLRVAAAIALAETAARSAGVKGVGEVRRNINQLLRNALSKP